jgi:hypothetical protein
MTVAIVVVAALLLVPGLGAALAVAAPGTIAIESRIALAFGLGYALVAGVATLLALAHVFSRPAFVVAVVVGTAAVWAVALRRCSPREHATALAAQARATPFVLTAGLAFLLAVAVSRLFYPEGLSLIIRSAWRYWADGLEVASAGRVPAETQQWGIEFPTTVSKVVLNCFEGGVSFLLGPEPLPAMHGILVVVAVGLAAALLALGRELGLGIFAPLVPTLSVLVPEWLPLSEEISNDLKWYTAEDPGRMVAFSALLAGIFAVRERGRGAPAVVTGVLLTLAGLTHLVPALVAGLLLAFFALAAVLVDRGALGHALRSLAVIVAVFGVCYVGILGLSGGDLGFQSAAGGTYEGFPPDVDPTRSLVQGKLVPRIEHEGAFLVPPRTILLRYGEETIDRRRSGRAGLLALAALFVTSLVMVVSARRFLPVATMAWGLVGAILALTLFFSYRYETRIPADFGLRRLYDYGVLVPALLVPALLAAVAAPLLAGRRAAVAVGAVAVAALAIGAAVARVPGDRSLARAVAGLEVIERVAEVVPCEARMLSNARTAGTWEATTGRRAVTEGHATYLRPRVMERVLPILIEANEFFADPAANSGFLARQRIDYLVVVKPNVWIGTNGARRPEEGDAAAVGALPNVHEVARERWVSIFAVGPSAPPPGGMQPRRCPL